MAIIFEPNIPFQRAEFTGGIISRSELGLIEAVVGWQDPSKYLDYIFQVHGRSLTLASPNQPRETYDRMTNGIFSGLQIFGAGGSMTAVRNGLVHEDTDYVISPTNSANHAKQLREITQIRAIDEDTGSFTCWHRAYAPLHGMDSVEASSRKSKTALFRENPNTPFVVPALTAEGVLPDKIDPFGDPLEFQVYRVPLVDRLPSQFFKALERNGITSATNFLSFASYKTGKSFRFMHENNFAYLDGHLGNMSLLSKNETKGTLYITDLGSGKDISRSKFKDRYRGLDAATYFDSLWRIVEFYYGILKNEPNIADPALLARDLHSNTISGFIEGYFTPELLRKFGPNSQQSEISSLIAEKTNTLGTKLLHFSDAQNFIEFFEQYFRKF